jgi:hypothetical protein
VLLSECAARHSDRKGMIAQMQIAKIGCEALGRLRAVAEEIGSGFDCEGVPFRFNPPQPGLRWRLQFEGLQIQIPRLQQADIGNSVLAKRASQLVLGVGRSSVLQANSIFNSRLPMRSHEHLAEPVLLQA